MEKTTQDAKLPITEEEVKAGIICLMCGVAGSGKTTFSKRLEEIGFARLSIDEYVWKHFGRYGIDYPSEKYQEHSIAARSELDKELMDLLSAGKPAVLDFSFWRRSDRVKYKKWIEEKGRPWKLIFLKVPPSVIRERLNARSIRFDANAAFPIGEDLLNQYLTGFETPNGEGEIVICIE
eukprot:TRINITY_DN2652_c0_g1_i1.p1 TRINITY_DN2652_c0_g1~~TRINITY_DN2652_c0_g1_i1.p1  ORF type:complete len:179 (-),score=52.54 TRINITY_DN2652_c0_g1_i1:697-1233(-)